MRSLERFIIVHHVPAPLFSLHPKAYHRSVKVVCQECKHEGESMSIHQENTHPALFVFLQFVCLFVCNAYTVSIFFVLNSGNSFMSLVTKPHPLYYHRSVTGHSTFYGAVILQNGGFIFMFLLLLVNPNPFWYPRSYNVWAQSPGGVVDMRGGWVGSPGRAMTNCYHDIAVHGARGENLLPGLPRTHPSSRSRSRSIDPESDHTDSSGMGIKVGIWIRGAGSLGVPELLKSWSSRNVMIVKLDSLDQWCTETWECEVYTFIHIHRGGWTLLESVFIVYRVNISHSVGWV